jgi:hypothetical protein
MKGRRTRAWSTQNGRSRSVRYGNEAECGEVLHLDDETWRTENERGRLAEYRWTQRGEGSY